MSETTLLPGVTGSRCPPAVRCDAKSPIRAARRRAWSRDAASLLLLVAVDLLFARWTAARLPFLDRGETLFVLRLTNFALIATIWITKVAPRWRAQRIASTWCRSERARFTSSEPQRTARS